MEIPLSESRGWLHEKCHKPLFSEPLGLYCALSVVVLTVLFKDGKQKVVAIAVLSGLQERLILWEMSMCVVMGPRGEHVGERVCALS